MAPPTGELPAAMVPQAHGNGINALGGAPARLSLADILARAKEVSVTSVASKGA